MTNPCFPVAVALRAAAISLFGLLAAAGVGQDPQNGRAVNDTVVDVAQNGDVVEHVVYKVTTADWNRLNAGGIGSTFFHRLLGSGRADWNERSDSYSLKRTEGTVNSFDLEVYEEGAALNRGNGAWEYRVTADVVYVTPTNDGGRPVVHFTHKGNILPAAGCISAATVRSGLGTYEGSYRVKLPVGATDVKWDQHKKLVSYSLPPVAADGAVRLAAAVESREFVMSTAYKIYTLYPSNGKFSDQWVARTVFKNSGQGVIRNLKVSYTMRHSDEVVHRFSEVVPGQTVVDPLYPSFLPSIADDPSRNVLPIQIAWSYEDGAGKRYEGNDSVSTVIIGRNGFVFSDLKAGKRHEMLADDLSNAPLLAAWVTKNDHPVKELAATAQDFATRLNANLTTEDKLEWLYNTLMVCQVQYKLPAVMQERDITDFDKKTVQNVYMPRDVISLRSGTCIDLAICYAALAFELNFDPYLMLIPGHCFPVIKVGSDFIGIEATMIQAGPNGGKPWREALQVGMKEFNDNISNPDALLVNVKDLWADGVSPPQPPAWEPDMMRRLGLDRDALWARLQGLHNAPGQVQPQQPVNNNPPVRGGGDTDFEGSWVGSASAGGNPYTLEVKIDRRTRTLQLSLSAQLGNARVDEIYEGPSNTDSTVLKLQTRTVTDITTKESRRDTEMKTEVYLGRESSNSIVMERQRRDRNEPKETFRLNRA
ncbi:MAG: hypothetical protein U1E73_11000 [Planctomycetota bacterium]